MSTENHTVELDGQSTGIRRELGRYTIDGTDRILFGQRVDRATIKIIDKPATLEAGRRSYSVDALAASEGYAALQALVNDYLAQAHRTNRIPAASVADDWVDDLSDSFRYDRERAAAIKVDAATDELLGMTTVALA
jgi:hypothetical protein